MFFLQELELACSWREQQPENQYMPKPPPTPGQDKPLLCYLLITTCNNCEKLSRLMIILMWRVKHLLVLMLKCFMGLVWLQVSSRGTQASFHWVSTYFLTAFLLLGACWGEEKTAPASVSKAFCQWAGRFSFSSWLAAWSWHFAASLYTEKFKKQKIQTSNQPETPWN